jgi:beta-lactamase class A
MRSGIVLSLSDLIFLMVSISDNTATNILIRTVGMNPINSTMRELRMYNSNLSRFFVGRLAIEGERENMATPNDYVHALDAIVSGEAASTSACEAMLTTLSLQQNRHRIGRYVPKDSNFRWGSKTGTNPGITNDVGFVTSSLGTMRIAILCRDLKSEVVGEQLIADATLAAMQSTNIFP